MPRRSTRLFEWLLLAMVIGIVLMGAVALYGRMAGDVQRLSFELAAQNFQTAVSGVRAEWYIRRSRGEAMTESVLYSELPGLAGREAKGDTVVYLNEEGWPANTENRQLAQDGRQTLEECLQLWQALLQEPPRATLSEEPEPEAVYQVRLGEDGQCRYRHLYDAEGRQYFDYWPATGRVSSYTPQ
ncbi:hypothetical protein [Marinimicrobium sp. C2-29]|uniref:hypothetical protein n=1 Tax=Marinimicrobium sp. C2-29 TaxID=3139825 RepID=UPI003139CBA9